MALEDILQEIEIRGKKEMDNLRQSYEQRLDAMRNKYLKMEEAIRLENKENLKSEAENLRRNIISSAQMESLRIIRGKEKQIMDQSLQSLEDYILNIRDKQYYPDLLKSLKVISQNALGKDCIILVDKKDLKHLDGAEESKNDELLKNYGGLVARSVDGSMEIDLRIYSIYQDLKEEISGIIAGNIGE